MLERETDIILQILAERTIAARDSLSLKEAISADMPNGVKAYMQAEVLRWLELDLSTSSRFARIDRSVPATNHVAKTILRTLALEYVFPREEYLTTLDHAVHFLENYLCRPRWTLEHFIFEDADRVPRDLLLTKLGYFADYVYFRKLIERIIYQKGWKDVPVVDFRHLIEKIDDQIIKEHSPRELGLLAKPIYSFLLLGDPSEDKSVPLKPILVFYEDKKMNILKDYVERICDIRKMTNLTLADLIGIVEDLYLEDRKESLSPVPSPEKVTASESADETKSDQTSPASHVHPQNHDEPAIHDGMPENIKETISSQSSSEPTGPIETTGDITGELHSIRSDGDLSPLVSREPEGLGSARATTIDWEKNFPLSLTYPGMRATNPTASLPDLYSLITKQQHEQFTKEVFKKDAAYYSGVIAALNKTHTWREASLFLNQLFQINGLDPFSDHVIKFTDAIHHRYDVDTKHTQ